MKQLNGVLVEATLDGLAGPMTALSRLASIEDKLTQLAAGPGGLTERLDDMQAQLNEVESYVTRLVQLNRSQLEVLRDIAGRMPAVDVLRLVAERLAGLEGGR